MLRGFIRNYKFSFCSKKINIFFISYVYHFWSSSLAPLGSEPRESITERFITKCSVVYARVSPRGSHTIDRMTNVPGSHRLHRGLVNQEIFSISMSREALFFLFFPSFLFCANIMPLPWQGVRKPHAKNDVTTLWKRSAKRGPHVNSARWRNCIFFSPSLRMSRLSAKYPPGVNRTQAGRDSAFVNSIDESRFGQGWFVPR